jgi:predicted Zn-dependent protease
MLRRPVKPKFPPLIYQYLKKYQEDPASRVFAPLCEAYRKAGLVDEAIEIGREGLRHHPQFMGGKVALARALFDKQRFQEVIDELSPIVNDIPDNLVAQRLLAESYLMQGQLAESLSAYKMLLYFSPTDSEVYKLVQELEVQSYENGALVLRADPERDRLAREEDLRMQKQRKIHKIEFLQSLLQRVERYRIRHQLAG